MIGDIVKGNEKSHIVLLEDTVDYTGRGLLAAFINNLLERVDEVLVICFDGRSRDLEDQLWNNVERIKFYNGRSDLLGWNKSTDLTLMSDLVTFLKDKGHFHGNKKTAVVIDSISPLMLYRQTPYTCQAIHKLADNPGCEMEQVVCLLHQDLHDYQCCSLVEHTSSTIIKMRQPSTTHHNQCCDILHKKISGKITRISENFNLTETFQIQDVSEVSTLVVLKQIEDDQIDPAANLTFNLTLSDKEKEARSQVKLPYTYDQQRQEDTLNKSVGEGKIFYQPDEVDDFDEEDPDDDLDI